MTMMTMTTVLMTALTTRMMTAAATAALAAMKTTAATVMTGDRDNNQLKAAANETARVVATVAAAGIMG